MPKLYLHVCRGLVVQQFYFKFCRGLSVPILYLKCCRGLVVPACYFKRFPIFVGGRLYPICSMIYQQSSKHLAFPHLLGRVSVCSLVSCTQLIFSVCCKHVSCWSYRQTFCFEWYVVFIGCLLVFQYVVTPRNWPMEIMWLTMCYSDHAFLNANTTIYTFNSAACFHDLKHISVLSLSFAVGLVWWITRV